MKEKRGQITLFIIIGILIVALVGVFLYIRGESIQMEEPEVIPSELMPVKEYIDGCMQVTLNKAVLMMGQQGGYLYIPEHIKSDPSAYIESSDGSMIKTPYWYHNGKSNVPSIGNMEKQISRYVEENLDACLRDFAPLEEQFSIEEAGNMTSKTTIGVNEVIITAKYPLNVKVKGTNEVTRIETFSASAKAGLRRMHELAVNIMTHENTNMFLEDLTIDLMTMGPNIPFTDMVFKCGQLSWYKPDVKKEIKNILYYNLPKIRFRGTEHEPFAAPKEKYENLRQYDPPEIADGKVPDDVPPDAYDYFHFYWDAAQKDYNDLQAGVLFLKEWPFMMRVRPSEGDIMSASFAKGASKYLSYLCVNIYHFTYDLVYPVEIVINDDDAFDGKGYSFRFAFPVMINHNKGDRTNFPISQYNAPEGNDGGYCDERTEETYDIRAKDANDFSDIKGANITFNCMNAYYCDLGKTGAEGGLYRLRTKLPSFCTPGIIEAEHEDYMKGSEVVPEDEYHVPVFMTPVNKLPFEVKKHRLTAGELMPAESLEKGEYAVIYLRSENFTDYNLYRKYPYEEGSSKDQRVIRLPEDDATYNLDVVLMNSEDEPIGGYRRDVKIKGRDVSSASRIIFNVIEKIPHPESDEENAKMLIDIGSENYTSMVDVELG
ncbi:MAG: hypothetical protein R6U32_00975 [Candidatus Woesearchaeota archaeon]